MPKEDDTIQGALFHVKPNVKCVPNPKLSHQVSTGREKLLKNLSTQNLMILRNYELAQISPNFSFLEKKLVLPDPKKVI